jgi:diaminopimelate decarboxylase
MNLQAAVAAGHLDGAHTAAIYIDERVLHERFDALDAAFPGALHAMAVKALPLPWVLAEAVRRGFGLEAASAGELALAWDAGASADRVVFDSPANTIPELEDAISRGVRVNADTLGELDRIAALGPTGHIGLRINPVVSGARISTTFTGGATSKFGVRLDQSREAIVAAYRRFPWLDGMHVHIGSQGCPLELLVEGVGRVADLASELDVPVLDIGGGLPVAYRPEDRVPSFADYALALRQRVPDLADRQLITEFGRAVLAPTGWVASRVEYVRTGATSRTAVLHVGADLFVRTAYRPESWYHRVEVYGPDGIAKTGPVRPWSLAGPLCFSGDYVAVARKLPDIEPGDIVVIRDAGAYTLSMWSRYNSRPMPAIWREAPGGFELLRPRETTEQVVGFWHG